MNNPKADIGVIGLGVMGESLALNIESHGFAVAVHNRSTDKMRSEERRVGKECRSRWSPYH